MGISIRDPRLASSRASSPGCAKTNMTEAIAHAVRSEIEA